MPSHVLIVEDERDLQKVIAYNLKQAGFDVVSAHDGETALRAVREERFDLVIFMGVLYHLRHPLLALDLIHEHVAGDMLLFQSLTRGVDRADPVEPDYDFFAPSPFERQDWPRLNFIEHRYSGDDSNWWVPNRAGVEAMLRSSGFRIEARPEAEVYLCTREAKRPWGADPVYPARG